MATLSKEEKELSLKVDHVLALYLIDVAEHVIVNFYKAVGVFITILRNCVNDLAWQKLANYKLILDFDSTDLDSADPNSAAPFKKRPPIFTVTKSACIDSNGQSGSDMIFLLANEFCSEYLMRKCPTFDKNLAIQLTKHLCLWLSHRSFSQYKLSSK